MAKKLELMTFDQIKEINLQPGDPVEVNVICGIHLSGIPTLESDNYMGYYVGVYKKGVMKNLFPIYYFYLAPSKQMAKELSIRTDLIEDSNLTRLSLNSIKSINRK